MPPSDYIATRFGDPVPYVPAKPHDLLAERMLKAAHELKNAMGRTYSATYHADVEKCIDNMDQLMQEIEDHLDGIQ
jgi:hypothetical protein